MRGGDPNLKLGGQWDPRGQYGRIQRELSVQLFDYLGAIQDSKKWQIVLELGAGFGVSSQVLAERCGGTLGILVDYCQDSLDQNGGTKFDKVLCDFGGNLPFRPFVFDLVVSVSAIQTLLDSPAKWKYITGLARDGGLYGFQYYPPPGQYELGVSTLCQAFQKRQAGCWKIAALPHSTPAVKLYFLAEVGRRNLEKTAICLTCLPYHWPSKCPLLYPVFDELDHSRSLKAHLNLCFRLFRMERRRLLGHPVEYELPVFQEAAQEIYEKLKGLGDPRQHLAQNLETLVLPTCHRKNRLSIANFGGGQAAADRPTEKKPNDSSYVIQAPSALVDLGVTQLLTKCLAYKFEKKPRKILFVTGFKEVRRKLYLRQLDLLIIPRDLKDNPGVEAELIQLIQDLQDERHWPQVSRGRRLAAQAPVPCFALTRKALGQALKLARLPTVCGILLEDSKVLLNDLKVLKPQIETAQNEFLAAKLKSWNI